MEIKLNVLSLAFHPISDIGALIQKIVGPI